MWIILILVAVPIIEIALFIELGGWVGLWPTIGLVIVTAILGGVLLRGGTGSLIGALAGAFILKTIASLMFFSGIPSLAQPLFEGLILAAAIAIGSADVLRARNKLEVFA